MNKLELLANGYIEYTRTVWVPCVPNYYTGTFVPLYAVNEWLAAPPVAPQMPALNPRSMNWSEFEDARLFQLISEFGQKNWTKYSRILNREFHEEATCRSGKHCRERWRNHLDPLLNSKF